MGVDGAANPGSALGVPAADRPFALWAPRAPQGRGMNVYYMCRAKRRKNCTCGNYFPSKMWKKRGHKWYCEVDWAPVYEENGEAAAFMKRRYGEEYRRWPKVGCGAAFKPFARGESMVVEVIASKGPMAFLPCPKRSPRVPHSPRVPRSPRCVRRPSTAMLPPPPHPHTFGGDLRARRTASPRALLRPS